MSCNAICNNNFSQDCIWNSGKNLLLQLITFRFGAVKSFFASSCYNGAVKYKLQVSYYTHLHVCIFMPPNYNLLSLTLLDSRSTIGDR